MAHQPGRACVEVAFKKLEKAFSSSPVIIIIFIL